MLLSLMLISLMSLLYLCLIRSIESTASIYHLAGALLWGGLSFGIAAMLHNHLAGESLLNLVGIQLMSAPVVEELLKALLLLVFLRIVHVRPGAAYGFAIGLGFALAESIVYINASPAGMLGTALARVISIHLIHGFSTAVVGLAISRGYNYRSMMMMLVLAMLVHAAFNVLVLSLNGGLLVLIAANAGVGSMIALLLLMSRNTAQKFDQPSIA